MHNNNSVVIGCGEVGQGLYDVLVGTYPTTRRHDIQIPDFQCNDIMHVCYPYSDSFTDNTIDWVKHHNPRMVIIHSTVPVGTTGAISDILIDDNISVFHSPIRGKHPKLAESIKVFVKFIGPAWASSDDIDRVVKYFWDAGVRTRLAHCSETTELLKLVSTTTYGLLIAFHQEIERWCKLYGVSYQEVVTDANITYNEGYQNLAGSQFTRPLIHPGVISGHCVMPNIDLLEISVGASEFLDSIIASNNEYIEENKDESPDSGGV